MITQETLQPTAAWELIVDLDDVLHHLSFCFLFQAVTACVMIFLFEPGFHCLSLSFEKALQCANNH